MAEIMTKEGMVVGLIEPTADTPQEKSAEQKPQEDTAAQKSTRRKQNDAE